MRARDGIDRSENLRILVRPTGVINEPINRSGNFRAGPGKFYLGGTRNLMGKFRRAILAGKLKAHYAGRNVLVKGEDLLTYLRGGAL